MKKILQIIAIIGVISANIGYANWWQDYQNYLKRQQTQTITTEKPISKPEISSTKSMWQRFKDYWGLHPIPAPGPKYIKLEKRSPHTSAREIPIHFEEGKSYKVKNVDGEILYKKEPTNPKNIYQEYRTLPGNEIFPEEIKPETSGQKHYIFFKGYSPSRVRPNETGRFIPAPSIDIKSYHPSYNAPTKLEKLYKHYYGE